MAEAEEALGARARVVALDIAQPTEIAAFAVAAGDQLGPLDAVFVNAGVARFELIEEVSVASLDEILQVNLRGAYLVVQQLSPLVRDGGAFVFTTVTGAAAEPGLSAYIAAKAGLRSLLATLSADLMTRRIRFNAVAPGFIGTPTMGDPKASPQEVAEMHARGAELTPMGRVGTPSEVARAAIFLAFDATFTTGVELAVDGGLAAVRSWR